MPSSWVAHTTGEDEVILVTRKGMAIRFPEEAVPSRGRAAGGVRGIRLSEAKDDHVVGMGVIQPQLDLLVIGERGMSKRTPMKEYRITNRGGMGIKTMSLTEKTGDIVDAKIVSDEDRLLIMTREGITIQPAKSPTSALLAAAPPASRPSTWPTKTASPAWSAWWKPNCPRKKSSHNPTRKQPGANAPGCFF